MFQTKKAELKTEVEVTAREKAELQAVTELQAVEMKDLKKNFEQLQVFTSRSYSQLAVFSI